MKKFLIMGLLALGFMSTVAIQDAKAEFKWFSTVDINQCGNLHNDYLSKCQNVNVDQNDCSSMNENIEIVKSQVNSNSSFTSDINCNLIFDLKESIQNSTFLDKFVSEKKISNSFKIEYYKFLNGIKDLDYLAAKNYLNNYISNMSKINLNDDEKKLFLSGLFLSQGSVIFWENNSGNETPQGKIKINWGKLGLDLGGFIADSILFTPAVGIGLGTLMSSCAS